MPSDDRYASPACLLGEVDAAYADPKYGLDEQRAALAGIAAALDATVQQLNRLLPRLPDGPLHAELTGLRDRQAAERAKLTSAPYIPPDRPAHR